MARRISLILLLLFQLTTLASCYDAHEISDFTFVTMFGIDEGISDKWRLTVQFRSVAGGSGAGQSGGGGGGSPPGFQYQLETIDAPSFFAAVNILNTNIPRRLNFEHSKMIVISEAVAKSGLVGEYIAPLVRYKEVRRTNNMIISEGSAEDFIQSFKPFIGSTVTKTIEDLVMESRVTGYFPETKLNEFYSDIKSSSEQASAALGAVNDSRTFREEGPTFGNKFKIAGNYYAGEVPRKHGNGIELLGSAVFDGDTMVGRLTGFESRIVQLLTGRFVRGVLTVQDPKAPRFAVSLDTRQPRKPKVDVRIVKGKPVIDLELNLIGDILAIQSRVEYEKMDLKPVLEKTAEDFVTEGIEKTVEKCKKLNCDVFNFSSSAVRQFGTIEEWNNYNWNKHFKDARVSIRVNYTVRRAGSMLKSMPVQSSGGKE